MPTSSLATLRVSASLATWCPFARAASSARLASSAPAPASRAIRVRSVCEVSLSLVSQSMRRARYVNHIIYNVYIKVRCIYINYSSVVVPLFPPIVDTLNVFGC